MATDNDSARVNVDKHKAYIKALDKQTETFEYYATEHLRMSGVYWGVTSMALLNAQEEMDREDVVSWVLSCYHEDCGGFGGNVHHDPHLLYTLSAVQILALYDALDRLDVDKVVEYVQSLQQEDGSFFGDKWGEVDTRFSYCAVHCLALLHRLTAIDVAKAVEFVMKCQNFDGGFGCTPGAETHGGQVFCCVGMLAIVGELHRVNADILGWWLAERQLPCGGLNGRPQKKEDVCYSWWVLASLCALGRDHWIDREKLKSFILSCQDTESGGFSDRPGDMADVFHTFFGIGGLSLLGFPGLEEIDPVFALPVRTLKHLNILWKRP